MSHRRATISVIGHSIERPKAAPKTVTEYFYTMQSETHGFMTVADTDEPLMIADREMALADQDKSDVSEMQTRTL